MDNSQKSGRAYKIGDAFREIPICIFARYSKLNKPPNNENAFYDKGLVTSLLLAMVDTNQIIDDKISHDVLDFVRGKRTSFIYSIIL